MVVRFTRGALRLYMLEDNLNGVVVLIANKKWSVNHKVYNKVIYTWLRSMNDGFL